MRQKGRTGRIRKKRERAVKSERKNKYVKSMERGGRKQRMKKTIKTEGDEEGKCKRKKRRNTWQQKCNLQAKCTCHRKISLKLDLGVVGLRES